MWMFKNKGGKVMEHKKSPYFNHEGYADPTAYLGTKEIIKEEEQLEKQVSDFVHIFKVICNLSGFEIVGRVQFKHKKTGRIFK